MRLAALFLLAGGLLPGFAHADTPIAVSTITVNTTWGIGAPGGDSVYTVQPSGSTLTIGAGATLIIQPGTRVRFASGKSLVIGGASTSGSLLAVGTPAAPIIFEAVNGSPNGWAGLDFAANSDLGGATSTLTQCIIRHGGSSGFQLRVTDSNGLTMTDCQVTQHSGIGLVLSGSLATVSGCVFDGSEASTFPASGAWRSVSTLFANNRFVAKPSGVRNALELRASDLGSSLTMSVPDSGFCYLTRANDDLVVDDAAAPVLTLLPGTMLKVDVGCTIMIGSAGAGGLDAEGVVFTSAKDDTLGDAKGDGPTVGAPGDWNALRIEASATDALTLLRGCTIRFSGANMGAGLYISGADPTVEDCLIERNNAIGLSVVGNGLGTSMRRNLLRDNTTYEVGGPVWALPQLVPQNDIRPSIDGKYNAYLVRTSDMASSRTLPVPAPGFCYVMAANEDIVIDNAAAPVLTLLPGTVMKFHVGCTFMVGFAGAGGLNAEGVVFTSSNDDTLGDSNGNGITAGKEGDWNALRIEAGATDALVVLRNCTLRFSGANYSTGLRIDAADPTVEDCLIERNNGAGIRITGAVSGAGIRRNLLRDNTTYEIAAPLNAIPALVSSNDIRLSRDGRYNAYDVNGGSATGTQVLPLPPLEMVYLFSGDVTVPAGASLTIPAPAVLKFNSGTRLTVSGALTTQGRVRAAPYAPVVFTSYRDDGWWGDTNGDGRTAPVAGDWERVELAAGSNLSVIRGAIFSHGGAASQGQLFVNNTGAQVSPAVQIHDCHFDVDLAVGGVRTTGSYALLDSCSFRGPMANLGVSNTSTLVTIDAPRCWWGAPSGPYDPPATDPCTNPGGTGVGVSNYVNYCPWSTDEAPVTSTPDPGIDITRTSLVAMGPIPSRGPVQFMFDLAAGDGVQLQVFDVSGRAVRRLEMPAAGARRTTLHWDGRDDEGRALRPGVYLLRIRGRAVQSTHRIVVVP